MPRRSARERPRITFLCRALVLGLLTAPAASCGSWRVSVESSIVRADGSAVESKVERWGPRAGDETIKTAVDPSWALTTYEKGPAGWPDAFGAIVPPLLTWFLASR